MSRIDTLACIRQISGPLEPSSPLAQQLELLHQKAAAMRGPLLDQLVVIDMALGDLIALFFVPHDERRALLRRELIVGLSLDRKIDLFTKIAGDAGAAIARDLDVLRGLRNDLAHGRPENTGVGMQRFIEHDEVKFVVPSKADRTRVLTDAVVAEMMILTGRCFEGIMKVQDTIC